MLECFVFEFWVLRFRSWVLRFRVLGASFSSFGCFVLRSSFSSASFSKLPPFCPLPTKFSPPKIPFSGTQTNTSAPNEDVAALTAEIARVRAENEALERETEVARLKAPN